jgi:hypothetical protein
MVVLFCGRPELRVLGRQSFCWAYSHWSEFRRDRLVKLEAHSRCRRSVVAMDQQQVSVVRACVVRGPVDGLFLV